jgi:NitT/TauT family transport system ATP-binding protein
MPGLVLPVVRAEASSDDEVAVEVRDLTVRFPDGAAGAVLAVERISLSIGAGEFVSIVGPSGCGKTTILNLLAGLLPVHPEGEARVIGKSPHPGNSDIAYMLARDSLLPWRTALGNAAYGLEIRGASRRESEARAMALLERVGLRDFADKYPKTLSQGMRQRCALARTFAMESPVFLMDEPFGALDAQTKLQLENLLLDLWWSNRRTVIFVTHDLGEAVALADRVVVMSARPGRIIADLPVDLARPRDVRVLQKNAQFHELYMQLWSLLERGLVNP